LQLLIRPLLRLASRI